MKNILMVSVEIPISILNLWQSLLSFLIGTAIDDGFIKSVNEPITNYIPELLERDSNFEKITIEHLLEMRSGLEYNTSHIPFTNIYSPWHDEAVGYYHPNVRKLLLENIDISSEPGKDFQYSNYNTCLLYTSPSPRDGLLSRMPSSA